MLDKPFDEITFEDVEDYCNEQHIETATLDYKKNVPADLSKHIAAMSNTMGALIIVGIEEDSKTGLPVKWEGIDPAGKPVDRVYAFIANVRPLPSCKVRMTNVVSGKVFVLVEVLEGDATPYYPVKDMTTVWLRTGNISTPFEPAKRDTIELLVNKKAKAESARFQNLQRAIEVQAGAAKLAEKKRLELLASGQRTLESSLIDNDTDALLLRLQPFYPHRELTPARDMMRRVGEYQTQRLAIFPRNDLKAGPDGAYSFNWGMTGVTVCDQVYANGLLYHFTENILRGHPESDETSLFVENVAGELYTFLKSAKKFYTIFDYHGLLTGELELRKIGGAVVHHIVPSGHTSFAFDKTHSVANNLTLPLELDTHRLADDLWLQGYFIERMERLYWSLGLEDSNISDAIKAWLKQHRLLIEPA